MADESLRIPYRVLAYLVEHPNAQDTLEGIVEWWLLEQEIVRGKAEVKLVLVELVAANLLCERHSRDRRIRYRLNPEKKDQIQRLLTKRKPRRLKGFSGTSPRTLCADL